jgi:O-antigen/teichoic acid export membrane protein
MKINHYTYSPHRLLAALTLMGHLKVTEESDSNSDERLGRTSIAAVSVVGAIISVLVYAVISRSFSQTELGIYQAAVTTMNLLLVFGLFGFEWTIPRFVARARALDDNTMAKDAIVKGLGSTLAISLLISGVLLVAINPLTAVLFNDQTMGPLIILLVLIIPIGNIATSSGSVLQGFEKFGLLAGLTLGSSIIRASAILILLYMGVISVLIGWLVGFAFLSVGSVLAVRYVMRQSFDESTKRTPRVSLKSLFLYAIPLVGYRLSNYFLDSLDQYLVLGFAGINYLGPYSVTVMATSTLSWVAYSVLFTILIPRMTVASTKFSEEGYLEYEKRVTRICFLILAPFFVSLVALSYPITEILSGTQYLSVAPIPTSIAALGLTLLPIIVVKMISLISKGKTLRLFGIFLMSFIVEISCGILFIPTLNLVGAALSKATAMTFLMIFLVVQDNSTRVPSSRVLALNVLSSIPTIGVQYILYTLIGHFVLGFSIALVIGLLVHVTCLISLGATATSDIETVFNHIPGGTVFSRYLLPRLARFQRRN